MSNLSTKQLKYLISLAQFCHFGKAAEHCYVSQSAFSIAIKELEDRLGVQVVDRTNRQVTMTPVGWLLVAQAKKALFEVERLNEIAQGAQDPLAGALRLGVIPTIAPFVLAELMQECQQEFPKLKLYVREDLTANLYQSLMDGQLDCLLLALPMPLRGVEQQVLYRDYFHFAWHKDDANAGACQPAELADDSVMLLEEGHCLRDHALAVCELDNKEKISHFAATSLNTLVQMVGANLGVTYLPDMGLQQLLQGQPSIHTSPLGPNNYREIGMVWRKGSARHIAFTRLGQTLIRMKETQDAH